MIHQNHCCGYHVSPDSETDKPTLSHFAYMGIRSLYPTISDDRLDESTDLIRVASRSKSKSASCTASAALLHAGPVRHTSHRTKNFAPQQGSISPFSMHLQRNINLTCSMLWSVLGRFWQSFLQVPCLDGSRCTGQHARLATAATTTPAVEPCQAGLDPLPSIAPSPKLNVIVDDNTLHGASPLFFVRNKLAVLPTPSGPRHTLSPFLPRLSRSASVTLFSFFPGVWLEAAVYSFVSPLKSRLCL